MRRSLSGLTMLSLMCLSTVSAPAQKKEKLKLPAVLQHHLDSIGSPDTISELKSLRGVGKGRLVILVGEGRILEGSSMLTSQGLNFRSRIQFTVSDFPGEDISFDGKDTYVAQLQAGRRSEIGDFLYSHESLLKEGLLGGVTTTAWPLLDVKGRRANLRYRGLKKIYDGELHEIEYQPRRGDSSLQIALYFGAEDFRHVATLVRVEVPEGGPGLSPLVAGGDARADASARQVSTRFLLEERFGDYREFNGLTLPHVRRVRLTREGQAANVGLFTANSRDRSMLEWQMEIESWELNPELDAGHFKIY